MRVDDPQGSFTTDAAIESTIEHSKGDVSVFTDGSVKRGSKSGRSDISKSDGKVRCNGGDNDQHVHGGRCHH